MLRMQLYSWSLARGSVQARGSLEIRLVFSGIAKPPAGPGSRLAAVGSDRVSCQGAIDVLVP